MKKIVFLTGTRADFGKLKSIMKIVSEQDGQFESYIFVTGMHMLGKYGSTYEEVVACNYGHIFKYINQNHNDSMDSVLAKTISGFSDFIKEIQPDMIIVHGDRVEALAGAIVGSLNNILVSHIEGGEVSGTIDELIRHAISKLSHLHFAANNDARLRLIQLGEIPSSIFVIGSPDFDLMMNEGLPSINEVVNRYGITFKDYGVLLYHPVTTETKEIENHVRCLVKAVKESSQNLIVIYPNNDLGSGEILKAYVDLEDNSKFKIYPSMRFEYFLSLLRHSKFIVGNSSAGVREAPFYGLPSVNIGSRQNKRSSAESIINCGHTVSEIVNAIDQALTMSQCPVHRGFGSGNSDKLFIDVLKNKNIWGTSTQKYFVDLKFSTTEKENETCCAN